MEKNSNTDHPADAGQRCIACGDLQRADARGFNSLFSGGQVVYLSCDTCGLMALKQDSFPSPAAPLYPDDYYGNGHTKHRLPVNVLRQVLSAWKTHRINALIPKRPIKVLDIGCGDGTFLAQMRKPNVEIYGVELSGTAFNRASRVENIHLVAAEQLRANTYPEHYFDVITLWHVLEHVPDPCQTLRSCRNWLAPDGYLFIEVPNIASWQAQLFKKNWFHLDAPRHLFLFTPRSLEKILQNTDFRIVGRKSFSFEMGVFGAVQSMLNAGIKPHNLLYDMLRSQKKCPGTVLSKLLSFTAAIILFPAGLLVALCESIAHQGAVIRFSCRQANGPRR